MYKLIIILFLIPFCLQGQYLHTHSELQRIIDQSPLSYKIDTLKHKDQLPFLNSINKNIDNSTSQQDNFIDLSEFQTNRKTKKYHKKANNYFTAKKYEKSLAYYRKVYETTESPLVLERMALCYEKTNQQDKAIAIYKVTLKAMPNHAPAHFRLAKIEHGLDQIDSAFKHINLAHLLDRNNDLYLQTLVEIYKAKGMTYNVSAFQPQYAVTEMTDSTILVKAVEVPWLAYATCKAVWEYEPGYKQKMKFLSTSDVSIIEEKECLLNALTSYERLKNGKEAFPALGILAKALPEKRVDDFILYEISSKRHPEIMKKMPATRLEQLVDYIVKYKVSRTIN